MAFLFLPSYGVHSKHIQLLRSEFQTVGSNIPHSVCMYDAFVMYNEEQCRLWSISYATYKLIVPSGPHLVKRRPCSVSVLCYFQQSAAATTGHIISMLYTYQRLHDENRFSLLSISTCICVYLAETRDYRAPFNVIACLVPAFFAATHRLGCGQQEDQVCPRW